MSRTLYRPHHGSTPISQAGLQHNRDPQKLICVLTPIIRPPPQREAAMSEAQNSTINITLGTNITQSCNNSVHNKKVTQHKGREKPKSDAAKVLSCHHTTYMTKTAALWQQNSGECCPTGSPNIGPHQRCPMTLQIKTTSHIASTQFLTGSADTEQMVTAQLFNTPTERHVTVVLFQVNR